MHPSIRRAYEERTHPLINHPIHGVYGKDLADSAHSFIKEKYSQATGSENFNFPMMMQLIQRAEEVESAHKEELEAMAIEIVKQIWGVTDELNFNADLTSEPDFELEGYEPEEEDDTELTPEEKKHADKRVTMNIMTHGAAQHQMLSLHHMIDAALKKIDPQLVQIYDKIAKSLEFSHWGIPLEFVMQQQGQQGGEVKIQWPEGEESEEDDGGEITVNAKAQIFPILIHELSKGVMEVLTAHGLPQDPALLKKVYKYADRPEHEFFHFLVGPEVWRRFLKVVGKRKLPEVIQLLATQEPDDVHKIIGTIIDHPEKAEELIDAMGNTEEYEDIDFGSVEESKKKKINWIAKNITENPDVAPAPVKPKPKPGTMPGPTKTPKKRPGPFRPPKPAEQPGPKAKQETEPEE
jgi:hypothetical protein